MKIAAKKIMNLTELSLSELKTLATELNVTPTLDKRKKINWVNAIEIALASQNNETTLIEETDILEQTVLELTTEETEILEQTVTELTTEKTEPTDNEYANSATIAIYCLSAIALIIGVAFSLTNFTIKFIIKLKNQVSLTQLSKIKNPIYLPEKNKKLQFCTN